MLALTPISDIESLVNASLVYQAPIWLDLNCKTYIRQYTCLYYYQEYGIWNITDKDVTDLKYNNYTCENVNKQCRDFYQLCDDVDFRYPVLDENENPTGKFVDPIVFITDHCYERSCRKANEEDCYEAAASTYVEAQGTCPDPLVIPSEKTLRHRSEVYIARYSGSECAISCPNTWYRSGTFYLNTYILYVISILSAIAGMVGMFQHVQIVYAKYKSSTAESDWQSSSYNTNTSTQANLSNSRDITKGLVNGGGTSGENNDDYSDDDEDITQRFSRAGAGSPDATPLRQNAAPKNTILSERVAFLCSGVSLSNVSCLCFLLLNNLSSSSYQCIGNAGFSKYNILCFIQGSLVVFTICWQQAWTGLICTDIYCIVRPFSALTKFFHGELFRIIRIYLCFIHPIVAILILLSVNYIGNYWRSEYNLCGPAFGKNPTGDNLFLAIVWVPIMVIGPVLVILLTVNIITTLKEQATAMRKLKAERLDLVSERQSQASMVSIEIEGPSLDHYSRENSTTSTDATGSTYYAQLTPLQKVWKNVKTFCRTFYAYRRIVFLLVSSILSLCAAGLIGAFLVNIDRLTQEEYYDCLFQQNAYDVQLNRDSDCDLSGKRLKEAVGVFILQVYMISFGFLPFFAFCNVGITNAMLRVIAGICGGIAFIMSKCCGPLFDLCLTRERFSDEENPDLARVTTVSSRNSQVVQAERRETNNSISESKVSGNANGVDYFCSKAFTSSSSSRDTVDTSVELLQST